MPPLRRWHDSRTPDGHPGVVSPRGGAGGVSVGWCSVRVGWCSGGLGVEVRVGWRCGRREG
eukprot:3641015-Prymnesium_polylepis.1